MPPRTESGHAFGRARPLRWIWLALFLSLLGAAPLAAQIPPDTIPTAPDTIPVRADTIPDDPVLVPIPAEAVGGDTIPEELRQAATALAAVPSMPPFPTSPRAGWDMARWDWGPEELARLPGMSLLEFIERLPGMTVFRAGGFGRPAGLTALGAGGGRVRVVIDGFELDPHDTGSFPLETISILDLNRVRVERSLTETLIEIMTFELPDPEPYSVVELGTGAAQTRALRALFSRGFANRSTGTGVFDLASTGGIGLREDYRHLNGVIRWSHVLGDDAGLQVEWRRTSVDREGTVFPQATRRDDFIFRTRSRFGDRLIVEGLAGRSRSEEDGDVGTVSDLGPGISSTQLGVRAAYATERLFAESALRGRFGSDARRSAPSTTLDGRVAYRPARPIRIEGAYRIARDVGETATAIRFGGTAHPNSALSLFVSGEVGSTLVPLVVTLPTEGDDTVARAGFAQLRTDVSGLRAGAELAGDFGSAGFAAFRTALDPVPPFSLPFDRGAPPAPVDPNTGVEGYFSLIVPRTRENLSLQGSFTRYLDDLARPYTPGDHGRVALVFHGIFIGGQLEPAMRIEGVRHGSTRVALEPNDPFGEIVPTYHQLNFSLQIRILDLQAFLLWDNIVPVESFLPVAGAPAAFPRVIYGGRWHFRN